MHRYYLLYVLSLLMCACQSTGENTVSETQRAVAPLEQMMEMAGHYDRAGEREKALVYYLKALELSPDDMALAYRVAELHKKMGKTEFALLMLERIIKTQPDNIAALSDAAMLLLESKQLAKATSYFSRAITLDQARLKSEMIVDVKYLRLDSQSPIDAYNGIGVAYDLAGRYTEAREIYTLCLEFDPHSPVILTNLGYSHYLSGNVRSAIDAYVQAIDSAPEYQRSWSNLGLVYARMGRYNKAFQTLQRVMSDAQAYNDLGYFLMLEQRFEEAEYFFEKAISASPKYYEVAYENLTDLRQRLSVMQETQRTLMP